ncbi:MAG: hypothetical protein IKN55_03335 [Oscillospiraceae bacterium]|nr:hypothetical protein [Oscillospiraceae bacterium]
MQEGLSELSKRYSDEMLRLYGGRQDMQKEASGISAPEPPTPDPEPPTPDSEPPIPDPEPPIPGPEPEDYADPVLPEYIRPEPPQLPEEWAAQSAYEKANTAEGRLRVVAAAADSAFPVPGARVLIYTRIGEKRYLNYLLTTDANGETPTVVLPAPPADLSQVPENLTPYAVCEIEISARGFFPTQSLDVHVFAGVTTRQEFQLVPLPLNMTPEDVMELSPEGRSVDEEVD